MRTPMTEDDEFDLQQIENTLRFEAASLLEHFSEASLPRIAVTAATPDVARRTATLSTAIAGLMLCMFGGWLAMQESATNVTRSRAETVEPADLLADDGSATNTLEDDLESLVEQFRDGYGRLPVLLRLVDDQGNAVGTGMYYPEQEVPVDFADLSPAEQQAAVRLLGMESSSDPGITI